MRTLLGLSAFALMLWLSSGCSTLVNVYSEEEPGINMQKYRSYEWLDNLSVEKDNVPALINRNTDAQIRSTVDAQMERLGFSCNNIDPDLRIHYHIIVKREEMLYQDWYCSDQEWLKYERCQHLKKVNYREGTMILDFIDVLTGNQVWRGVAVGVVDDGLTPEQKTARINEAVQAIFKKFPDRKVRNYAVR